MKLTIFGLTITSTWGNGHATLWRGLTRALARRGHQVAFFERDQPWYAQHRDVEALDGVAIHVYPNWCAARAAAEAATRDSDAAIVTSYCADALEASALVTTHAATSVFYDMDAPITLQTVRGGGEVPWIGQRGLRDFDLVLSYAGGNALSEFRDLLGARHVEPLYGSVDPEVHRPVPRAAHYRNDLSYLGTYAGDRQGALERFFVEPARRLPAKRFVIGGAQYPDEFPWADNIFFVRHLPPSEHSAFFCSSALTLNITRAPFVACGFCPSGRLFEAAACGAAILSDAWTGIETFFGPGSELLVATTTDDVVGALSAGPEALAAIGRRARERALDEHTADHRAAALERLLAQEGR